MNHTSPGKTETFDVVVVGGGPAGATAADDLARQGRLRLVDGNLENAIPGIDLHAAPDTHTYGCQWVHVRNDMQSRSRDRWVLAGDLIYVYENMEGTGGDKMYVPVGLALGSTTNLVMTTEEIMKSVDYEVKRVIPVHEERLKEVFPSRILPNGLRISEICLATGQKSLVA